MKLRVLLLSIAVITGISCKPQVQKEVILKTDNGDPKLVYHIAEKDGKKERIKEEVFYDNGKLQYEGEYKDDKPFGKWKYYFENGKLFAEGTFDGSEQGKDWKFFDKEGKRLHPKDQLEIHSFGKNNQPVLISFKDGEKQYEYQFYPNFVTCAAGMTIDDKKEGLWVFWFKNGNKQTEAWFVNDIQQGEQVVYRENGQVYYKGNFENGKRTGEWNFFDNEGNLTDTKIF